MPAGFVKSQNQHLLQRFQYGNGFRVGQAIVAAGPVVHLKCRNDVFGGLVQQPVLGRRITQSLQFVLYGQDVWQACALKFLHCVVDGCLVVPAAEAGVGQLFPGKARTGVDFALWGDVAVPDDVVGFDLVPSADVVQQGYQGFDLHGGIGRPACSAAARVDDFNADRTGVQVGASIPFTDSGVPGATVFIDQLVNFGPLAVGDQVVTADVLLCQYFQRGVVAGRGVVQDDEIDTAILAFRLQAAVDLKAGRTVRGAGAQQG